MATGSENDFAEVTEEITLENFKMWTVESLRIYLSLRKKIPEGDFKTLVDRFVLLYHSEIFFFFGRHRSKNILLVSCFIYKAVASMI